jgi:hypothetical protein
MPPETQAFAKARDWVQNNIIKKNAYDPYFDETKRYDADISKFAPYQDTSSQLMKRPETVQKYEDWARGQGAIDKLNKAFDVGFTDFQTTGNWYMMGQLADEFSRALGPVEGPKAFKTKFSGAMAATTGGSSPSANFINASYGNYLAEKGLPTPGPHEMPYPVGGRGIAGNMAQYDKMIREGAGVTPENPKRYNFDYALSGEPHAYTIDEQMMAPYGATMPPTGSYGHFQRVGNELAAARGIDPRGFQDVGWAGLKKLKKPLGAFGGPMIRQVNQAIERTRYLTGASPEEVVNKGIIRSQRPIYSNPRRAMAPLLALMRGKKPVLESDLGAAAPSETPVAPPFYSAVEQAVSGAKQNKAPGSQWLGMLKNAPGIKPEELETLGLPKYLSQDKAAPQGDMMGRIGSNVFTKREVLDQIRANKTAVEDKLLGPPPGQPAKPKRPKADTSPATEHEISDVLARAQHGWTGLEEDLADAFRKMVRLRSSSTAF